MLSNFLLTALEIIILKQGHCLLRYRSCVDWRCACFCICLILPTLALPVPACPVSPVDQSPFHSPHSPLVQITLRNPNRTTLNHHATGVLLDSLHVLTVAHAVLGHHPSVITIQHPMLAGIDVAAVSIHPSYTPEQSQHDLALLRLSRPLPVPRSFLLLGGWDAAVCLTLSPLCLTTVNVPWLLLDHAASRGKPQLPVVLGPGSSGSPIYRAGPGSQPELVALLSAALLADSTLSPSTYALAPVDLPALIRFTDYRPPHSAQSIIDLETDTRIDLCHAYRSDASHHRRLIHLRARRPLKLVLESPLLPMRAETRQPEHPATRQLTPPHTTTWYLGQDEILSLWFMINPQAAPVPLHLWVTPTLSTPAKLSGLPDQRADVGARGTHCAGASHGCDG
jgi:hypothetical protein